MARTMGTEALRRLAFLAGGTGGRGTGAPTMWAPTWYGGGVRRTLAWTAQTCCGAVDFMAPWRVVRWQPDSMSFLPLSDKVVGNGEEAKDAAATLQALHELAGAVPEEAVPDGAVPAALPRFLRLMGMAEAEMTGALLGMEGGALRMVARVAKQRAIQVTRHWQTVGIPLESLGTERFPTLAACHGCGGKFRTLFHVKPKDGLAATKVAEEVVSAILERISERVEGGAEEGMRVRLRHAMQGQGVFVCFCCAAPVVREKRRQGGGLAARGGQSPQQASASRAGAAPADRPSPTRTLPQRTRGSPERFVPAADRVRQRRDAIREAERDQEATVVGEKAVLAELRAIGLSVADSTGVLRPVQAREVRGLAKRLVGSTDLLGQVFRWEGEDYLVNDIAPGPTQSGGQALKAYACCVKRRVASAGPLSEHNSAFDIRAVRDRIEKDRARGEATRLLGSLRPDVEREGGEAGPSANPGPAPPPPEGRRELGPSPRAGWTAGAWNHGWNDRRGRGHPLGPHPRSCGGRHRHQARPHHHRLRPRRWSDRWVEEPPLRVHTRRCGRQCRHRSRHPHCHFRLHPRRRRGRHRMDPLGIT